MRAWIMGEVVAKTARSYVTKQGETKTNVVLHVRQTDADPRFGPDRIEAAEGFPVEVGDHVSLRVVVRTSAGKRADGSVWQVTSVYATEAHPLGTAKLSAVG